MSNRTQVISVHGAKLAVEMEGQGDPLVLVHGFGEDRRTWEQVAQSLSSERLVIRYDLRGYGDFPETEDVPFRHSQDLLALLDHLNITRCDLMGVSMGGGIALNFSLDAPERVRRLLLISPGIVGWDWSEEWRSQWAAIKEAARDRGLAEARELWWNHPLFATTRANSAARRHLQQSIFSYSGKHWLHDNEAPAYPDIERLHELRPSTLLLSGTRDLADFQLIADLIQAAAPDVVRVNIEGAGHLPHLECPQQLIEIVTTFLVA